MLQALEYISMADVDWELGTYSESDPFLAEFNAYLAGIDVPVAFTRYDGSNYISTYVPSIGDVFLAREVLTAHASATIDAFFIIARKHGYIFKEWAQRERWEPENINHVYSFEVACMREVVRKSKEEVRRALGTQLGIKPEYVFSHSENDADYTLLPGYVLFFYKAHEQLLALDDAAKKQIRALCNDIVRKNDKTGFCKKYHCALLCCDEITHPDSLYGFSRED